MKGIDSILGFQLPGRCQFRDRLERDTLAPSFFVATLENRSYSPRSVQFTHACTINQCCHPCAWKAEWLPWEVKEAPFISHKNHFSRFADLLRRLLAHLSHPECPSQEVVHKCTLNSSEKNSVKIIGLVFSSRLPSGLFCSSLSLVPALSII